MADTVEHMQCVPCGNAVAFGWWGPGHENKTHCRGCHRSWPVATKEVHCLRCHESFSTIDISDWHDRTGACLKPEGIRRKDGTPVYEARQRTGRKVWVTASTEPHPFADVS